MCTSVDAHVRCHNNIGDSRHQRHARASKIGNRGHSKRMAETTDLHLGEETGERFPVHAFHAIQLPARQARRESKLHQICTHADEPGGKGDGQNLSCRPWSVLPSEVLRGRIYYTTVKKHCVVSSTVQSSIHLDCFQKQTSCHCRTSPHRLAETAAQNPPSLRTTWISRCNKQNESVAKTRFPRNPVQSQSRFTPQRGIWAVVSAGQWCVLFGLVQKADAAVILASDAPALLNSIKKHAGSLQRALRGVPGLHLA